MRCTRCDGLVVPQAVGIAPDGKVIFGWCLQCLADRGCKLVETSPVGPWRFTSIAATSPRSAHLRHQRSEGSPPGEPVDRTQRALTIVAFLMMCWGLILLTSGLWSTPLSAAESSRLGNGTPALLVGGGSATAVIGVVLLLLSSRRNWYPGTFLLGLLSWLSFALALVILLRGIVDHQPRRNVALVLGAGLSLGIAALSGYLHRAQARTRGADGPPAVWKPSLGVGGSRAGERRPSL